MERALLIRLTSKFLIGDDCWEWTAHRNSYGYGIISINYKNRQAHRIMYEEFIGPIPEELQLDHLCRNRACVRPDHLEPVTCGENLNRGHASRGTTMKHGLGMYTSSKYRCRCDICTAANTEFSRRHREKVTKDRDVSLPRMSH